MPPGAKASTTTNSRPCRYSQSSGRASLTVTRAQLTTRAPRTAPHIVPRPPTATQQTMRIEGRKSNWPGETMPNTGAARAPARPAMPAAITKPTVLTMAGS